MSAIQRRRTLAVTASAAAVVAAVSLGAAAQPRPKGGPAPKGSTSARPATSAAASSSSSPAEPPRGLAIGQVADEAARGLGAVPAGALVVTGPLTSDVEAPRGDDLALRVAAQLAGKLTASKVHAQVQPLGPARAAAGRAGALVFVSPEIAKGVLRVSVDLYPVVSNGWERVRNPLPAPRAHAFAQAPIDAEVRAFLAPIVLERAQIHRARHDEGEIVAIGCGDVDQDGGLDLVTVSHARVAVGRLSPNVVVRLDAGGSARVRPRRRPNPWVLPALTSASTWASPPRSPWRRPPSLPPRPG